MQTKKYRKNTSKRNTKKNIGGTDDDNVFLSDKFNVDPNKKYKTVGIAHHTELAGINVLRDIGNDFANFFGQSGFDSGLYNRGRNDAIKVVINKLSGKQILKDPKFDIELKEQQGIQIHFTALILEEITDKQKEE
jgi:hypothetical protein